MNSNYVTPSRPISKQQTPQRPPPQNPNIVLMNIMNIIANLKNQTGHNQ